ncbi:molybdopterin-dependent oxidoreductase [Klebsiella pneumoniae]|nr:molybdopterin-dependent oxidoreductase [Klebsiella pneumoniae]
MTNHWVDIKNANVVVVMGGNAAEAHPVGFRWAMEAKNNNDATLIVVDPRFTRTASVADIYAPIRSGTDITFLSGVLLYLIENNKINAEYVKHYTNASLLVRDDFAFEEGLFSGYDGKNASTITVPNYQFDCSLRQIARKRSPTRAACGTRQRSTFPVTRPEVVENICGTPKADFLQVGMCWPQRKRGPHHHLPVCPGWTQHTVGAQNIRTMAMDPAAARQYGMAGGGATALRGYLIFRG